MSDEGELIDAEPPRWPAKGKAGRNKGRDLTAGALNNVAVALLLAALLQPSLSFVQQQRPVDGLVIGASLAYILFSAACFVGAQWTARRTED